ncbi:Luciferase-like monooxygenase [Streptomyces sp. 3213]|uniref:LLM class flavin-dependent oxidoreductase n=1 Tax=Streptomyces sp. 3213.3 TaxID=1855348 RepID=UPI00089C807D|nr:Luciferase-like monooxygenase [Streptomyces sp. 3213] [Streptomyces sp. 3213.3]
MTSRQAAVSLVSGIAGLGSGWSLDEYAAAGVRPFAERGKVMDEVFEVCRAVWGPDPVVYEGGRVTGIASANTPRSMRRLVDHADGRLPYADGPEQVAASRGQLQDLAAERGRTRPLRTVVRVNPDYTAKRYEGSDRRPCQGDVEQIVGDLMEYDGIGLDEFLVDRRDDRIRGPERPPRAPDRGPPIPPSPFSSWVPGGAWWVCFGRVPPAYRPPSTPQVRPKA